MIRYESPLTRLSDHQIKRAIERALARGDRPFVGELVHEVARRGQPLEV